MQFLAIQLKPENPDYPMNGKLLHIGNIKSIGYSDGILFVNHGDEKTETQFPLEKVSYFFISLE